MGPRREIDQAAQTTVCRLYAAPDLKGRPDRVALYASNYGVLGERHRQETVARFELFRGDPSMEGWAAGTPFWLSAKGVGDG